MYTSLKLVLSILFCVFFIVGCSEQTTYSTPPEFHEHPDTAKIEYPDTNIYYVYDGAIYQHNVKTKIKKELVKSWTGPYLSHDKTKFIYTAGKNNCTLFYLYTIKTGENKLVYTTKPMQIEAEFNFDGWSPDNKYIIISSGEGEVSSMTLVEVATGKVVTEFETFGQSYWINSQEILTNDIQDNIDFPRSNANGTPAHGIAILNIETKQKKIIKQATPTEDYLCMVDDNNQILVKQSIYKLETVEHQTKITDTKEIYFVMNKEGNQIKQIPYDPWESESNNYIILKNELKELLPLPYKNYKDIQVQSLPNSNWVVLILNNNYEVNEFFIMDKTNPHSLSKIGDGSYYRNLF